MLKKGETSIKFVSELHDIAAKHCGYNAASHVRLFQVSGCGLVPLTTDNRGSTVYYKKCPQAIHYNRKLFLPYHTRYSLTLLLMPPVVGKDGSGVFSEKCPFQRYSI